MDERGARGDMVRTLLLLCCLLTTARPVLALNKTEGPAAALGTVAGTVILADPADGYYPLAQEISKAEMLPIVHALDEALAANPEFLLWVVSPAGLSDEALVAYGLAVRDRPSAVSTGIISGETLEDARALWQRAADVRGARVVAANAANPSGLIEAGITSIGSGETTSTPLTEANLIHALQNADYLTYTGHGGTRSLHLDEETTLAGKELPLLPPAVVATGSCNTFRPWEEDSLALAFVRQGAAAYAGFAYSPNEGYLIGEFDGLPYRYTWPEFPVGHAVQVQNHGTLQGFAQFPYYHLLGDPRIALQSQPPYRLLDDNISGDTRTLTYSEAPAGMLPVRIAGGAHYGFVQVRGTGAASDGDKFYNSRLQMANIGQDKFVLLEHQGGPFTIYLSARPPWAWAVRDPIVDALDTTLLFLPSGDSVLVYLAVGVLALVPVLWCLLRRRPPARTLAAAVLLGLGFAALHGLYALARLDQASITSKRIEIGLPALVGTWLLVGCGAFLFLTARSWPGRLGGLMVASFGALGPAAFVLSTLGTFNLLFFEPKLGASLYSYSLGLQPLIVLGFAWVSLGAVFFLASKNLTRRGERNP